MPDDSGHSGATWDLDGDGFPDYFWPGTWEDAPAGFLPQDYDCTPSSPSSQVCAEE